MHVLKPEAINITRKRKKYTECTYKHKNYLYIFIYIKIHSKENGETIMHKQSSRSEWANKPTKEVEKTKKQKEKKKKKARERWRKTWKRKKSQIWWSPWHKRCERLDTAAALRVAFDVRVVNNNNKKKNRLNQVWAGVVCACECVVGGRMWHPVSKLACDGEGTLRFQGYLFSSIPKEFHRILNLIFVFVLFFNSYLLLYGKKKILFFFFTNRIVLCFFFNCFFFSEKTNICFFFFPFSVLLS